MTVIPALNITEATLLTVYQALNITEDSMLTDNPGLHTTEASLYPSLNITEASLFTDSRALHFTEASLHPSLNITVASNVIDIQIPFWETLVTVFILGVIIIFTVLGNIFVIVSVFTYEALRIVPNYLIASLAISDLLVGIFVSPIQLIKIVNNQWIFGLKLCKAWLTLDVTFCTASIWNLCAIALDRYQAISNPGEYRQKRTEKRALYTIVIVWVLPLIVSLPPLFGWNNWDGIEFTCEYATGVTYTFYSITLSFYLPLIITATLYYKMMRCIKEHAKLKLQRLSNGADRLSKISIVPEIAAEEEHASKRKSVLLRDENKRGSISFSPDGRRGSLLFNQGTMSSSNRTYHNSEQRQRISLSKETRAARILGLIMVMFVFCWLPFFVMIPISALCPSCSPVTKIYNSIVWLGYINSAINPVIYTIFNDDFKKAFNSITNKVIGNKN